MNLRSAGLTAALTATAVAAYFAPDPGGSVVAPAPRKPLIEGQPSNVVPAATAHRVKPTGVLRILSRSEASEQRISAGLAPAPWAEPPALPPPKVASAPPQPSAPVLVTAAPPLPFKVLGRFVDNDKPALFLQHNDQNLVVRAGDTIAGQYKVEGINDGSLTLLHLSTSQKQTLAIGSAP